MARKERWVTEPEEKDYLAAERYLTLLTDTRARRAIVDRLRRAPIAHHRANDLLRAAGLPLLPVDDPEVVKDLRKVKKGGPLGIVLLVRGRLQSGIALTVADGYHRICASYHLDEDAEIPCQMADVPAPGSAR